MLLRTKGVVWFGRKEAEKHVGGDGKSFLRRTQSDLADASYEEVQRAILAGSRAVSVVDSVDSPDG